MNSNIQDLVGDVLDQLRGMWRYRWHMLIVAWLLAIPGWGAVYNIADVYEATARVAVDTNSLLPDLTEGLAANESVAKETDLVREVLMSRPNIEAVARETDLDLRAVTPGQMERLITGLQDRIEIRAGRDNIFEISFRDTSREKAVEVVAALLNTFIESSLSAQGDDTNVTERVLRTEIEDHEQRLSRAETELAQFKKRNLGYMPDDGADYYTRLQAALAAVAEMEQKIRQLRERRNEISRQLEGEEPVFGIMPSTPAQARATCSKAGSIAQLKGQLDDLQVEFTDKHPRIVILRDNIVQLEEECIEELAANEGFAPVYDSTSQSLNANPVYQNLRLQLSNADVELAALQEELGSKRRLVNQLRSDVDKIAEVEAELKRVNRDYVVVESRHQELLRRWETLQSSKRLEPVTDDVDFNVLDPPFASVSPVAPNRPLLLAGVLIVALGLGGALTFGLNQLNPVFYTRHTVARVSGLPVLGSVSMIISPRQRAARRGKLAAWLFGNIALLTICGVVVVYHGPIRDVLITALGGI